MELDINVTVVFSVRVAESGLGFVLPFCSAQENENNSISDFVFKLWVNNLLCGCQLRTSLWNDCFFILLWKRQQGKETLNLKV